MQELTIFIMFLILSIIVEYVVKLLKPLIAGVNSDKYPLPLLLALAVGICISVLVKADLLSAIGFAPTVPIISWIITGILVSGGSSVMHELIAKLRATRQDL